MTGKHTGRWSAARIMACGLAFSFLPAFLPAEPVVAQQAELAAGFRKGRETGYPVPRFVSLKSNRARMRIGPSTDYATKWVYTHQGMPFEITEEYGNWRRVRDVDGVTGWMSGALLSGDRTAIVGPWLDEPVALRRTASSNGRVAAQLSPKVMMHVGRCDGTWCAVHLQRNGLDGYLDQSSLWGVYPGERFE
ncbi:SH3 domain-containing protein [Neorhizobium sp. T786]|uniref:SH3 domain-containing protein n=1 Tax=Pseudorhizobium xiangyangii TaxID=2883104 RepID=UPI001CFF596B|nr:SH3 domain-containing protein [Neorhizobium xiangyangii]MCB5201231.1 SH3 domain-containing protein [Neorhizobium xiangyangii]